MAVDEPLPDDDGPIPMTAQERTVWASLVTVIVSSGAYFALMVPRLVARPVPEISWVTPMLWTIGLSVVGAVVFTIAFEIIAAASRRGCGAPAERGEVTSDVRDREIGRIGWGASMTVISVGFGGALVLAMLDADTFWIGNLLFLFGTVSAVVETVTRIRLYRRGF
ncbi:hypothetical protein [Couchioplanes caeruleus]|uniref:DUF2178 domain-containing protein n=2 Tax=Couchioplanes caeruleus TaxID=56438 RepID=A0A1K0FPS2_9ACTN|nr:hypothetical protein [Couchioplanes caeruleus]OJF14793.1 hypothetical protein BG844_07930 [Couchioplanes caeruleus subsp. caeruleus]ROP27544.1 hypothetical protein EDD30_0217 [Couchioplanes caeruleus]